MLNKEFTAPTANAENTTPSVASGEMTSLAHEEYASQHVVFQSNSEYDLLTACVLVLPLCVIFVPFVPAFSKASHADMKAAIISTVVSFVIVVVLFVLVLPRRFEVLANGSLRIQTLFVGWIFTDLESAHENPSFLGGISRPRYKFATSLSSCRVLVHRRNGKWDVLVSPEDPSGFVAAVKSVVPQYESPAAQSSYQDGGPSGPHAQDK